MLKIDILSKKYDRKNFDCGQDDLNKYLRQTALQHIKKNISKTFVLANDKFKTGKKEILGFYTLSNYIVIASQLPPEISKKYPKKLPALLLGRLAVSLEHKNKGLGSYMMLNAMERTLEISKHTGIFALFVDAKNEKAGNFYKKFGFISFPEYKLKMYLPVSAVEAIVNSINNGSKYINV